MELDPYTSLWISNSALNDFAKCPRAYFIKNIYRDKNSSKVSLVTPATTLGTVVHEVLEKLGMTESDKRINFSYNNVFEDIWENYIGELGGFTSKEEELTFKERGKRMIKRVADHPGVLLNKSFNRALSLKFPDGLPPRYDFSLEHEIIICGNIDWVEYNPDGTVNIIDFKTGKEEDPTSLQLAIYCLLVENILHRKVKKVSYWYLDREDNPTEVLLPDTEVVQKQILHLALQLKNVREKEQYDCLNSGCISCRQLEPIVNGQAKLVCKRKGKNVYIVRKLSPSNSFASYPSNMRP